MNWGASGHWRTLNGHDAEVAGGTTGDTLGEGGRGRRVHLSAGLGLDCRGYRASHRWAAPFWGYRGCGRAPTYRSIYCSEMEATVGYSGVHADCMR